MEVPSAKSLGEQELELLRWIAQHGQVSVAEVTERFGTPLSLSRSTLHTVMERLRTKGYLTRCRRAGVYLYASPVESDLLLNGLVKRFVEKTLAGSLSPLIAYFATAQQLSAEERGQLERLLSKLQAEESAAMPKEVNP